MVKIRLKRLGYKKNPFYRIIVINEREKRQGAAIVEIGHYDPKKKELKLNKELALEWIKKGAQPTDTVKYLINNCDAEGQLIRKETEVKKLSKKAKVKLEAEEAAKKAAAAAAAAEATPAE